MLVPVAWCCLGMRVEMMIENLSEDEMRQALFGSAVQSSEELAGRDPQPALALVRVKRAPTSKPLSPKLRVTLHVTKTYEGPQEVFVHDANTLSSLVAEAEAKAAAKRKKFRYFEVMSIESV
ncbi:hypothetical protein ALP82_01705 [Pseudomonas savastanoi pv. fraxini]|nr:Uncharacterized protein ALO58_00660 [Pseudomonas savastanoi pv. savastanoi]KUG40994.1 Uncharacterized protein ALP79_01854 [Pseudomonas savastanoi pv. fraxini]RMN59484.1 hypothetical protein ALQ55_02216 [Pseudomonas savastanoi pv. savastanoi]RMR63302.1 hypothetical protein ALP82_01705 [Pseudomonas savastanoi pv. fraxini]RMR70590.1 hypothetical protein ALP80_00634 [Pseudomonas savastanoi pv. fraxini]